jgi:hypothetical protein
VFDRLIQKRLPLGAKLERARDVEQGALIPIVTTIHLCVLPYHRSASEISPSTMAESYNAG